ncbi:MAG: DUF6293 family protein [Candidatus Hermodarchaeota archaeon]
MVRFSRDLNTLENYGFIERTEHGTSVQIKITEKGEKIAGLLKNSSQNF